MPTLCGDLSDGRSSDDLKGERGMKDAPDVRDTLDEMKDTPDPVGSKFSSASTAFRAPSSDLRRAPSAFFVLTAY